MTMVEMRLNVERALDAVRAVLSAEKDPCLADRVHHEYRDKYLLTECMTNVAISSVLNVLGPMGLSIEAIAQLKEWAAQSTVSLKFRAEERCTLERTQTREVESATKHKDTLSIGGRIAAAVTSAVVTTVTDHFYTFTASYELLAVRGTGREEADRIVVLQRSGRQELVTTAEQPPRPEALVPAQEDSVDMTWLFRHLQPQGAGPAFLIDRSHAKCKTPTRNPDVEGAINQFQRLQGFLMNSQAYLLSLFGLKGEHRAPGDHTRVDFSALDRARIFIPVMPLLDNAAESDNQAVREAADAAPAHPAAPGAQPAAISLIADAVVPAGSALLSSGDTNALLQEEISTLLAARAALGEVFPEDGSTTTASDALLVVTMGHIQDVCDRLCDGVAFVESMLRTQLIAAIGKQVPPADFAEYMRYHCAKLLQPAFAPAPFSYAVRRSPGHSPEGTVSIEQEIRGGESTVPVPIETVVAKSSGGHPMTFKLGASTEVRFDGEKYLHAWIDHRFEGESGSRLALVARARQFCSMVVLVGRISSATSFDPTYAAIVQNKDELTVPLGLSTIPTPKEFKDAIHSLSPEQQAFAKAFRSMQLEGTLFGVLVVQIKPQLERVLSLHPDGLTKEIKLTQDLMELFLRYQIPCDLLSYDASRATDDDDSAAERIAMVRSNVERIQSIVEEAKREEVEEARRRAEMAEAQREAREGYRCMISPSMSIGAAPMAARKRAAAPMAARAEAACAAGAPACAKQCGGPAPPMEAAQACAAPAQQPQLDVQHPRDGGAVPPADGQIRDYTQVPKQLDEQFERLDTDSALRPTKIEVGKLWSKSEKKSLLAGPTRRTLLPDDQKNEKGAAFDLLDALTKSGALPLADASLHILVAATHCFDRSVTETVVQDNMNPIEKVERSVLIMASTVHQRHAAAMIDSGHQGRVRAASPALFLGDGA